MDQLTCIPLLVYYDRLLSCPSFPFWSIRAPTSSEGCGSKLFAKLNIELVFYPFGNMLIAKRD